MEKKKITQRKAALKKASLHQIRTTAIATVMDTLIMRLAAEHLSHHEIKHLLTSLEDPIRNNLGEAGVEVCRNTMDFLLELKGPEWVVDKKEVQ